MPMIQSSNSEPRSFCPCAIRILSGSEFVNLIIVSVAAWLSLLPKSCAFLRAMEVGSSTTGASSKVKVWKSVPSARIMQAHSAQLYPHEFVSWHVAVTENALAPEACRGHYELWIGIATIEQIYRQAKADRLRHLLSVHPAFIIWRSLARSRLCRLRLGRGSRLGRGICRGEATLQRAHGHRFKELLAQL